MISFEKLGLSKRKSEPGENVDWMVTGRPFVFPQELYPPSIVQEVLEKYGEWQYSLGFSRDEVQEWIKTQIPVLEVGPGIGNSFLQLFEMGVNIFAIEPSLLSKERTEEIKATHQNLDRFKNNRIMACKAEAAPRFFDGQQFDVIFANGVNFPYYSRTAASFMRQLKGLMAVLSSKDSSFLSFAIHTQAGVVNSLDHDRSPHVFHLINMLNDSHIRHEVHFYYDGEANVNARAIKIFKLNDAGEDASEALEQVDPNHYYS